jgi:hypothetical protein
MGKQLNLKRGKGLNLKKKNTYPFLSKKPESIHEGSTSMIQ